MNWNREYDFINYRRLHENIVDIENRSEVKFYPENPYNWRKIMDSKYEMKLIEN